MRFYRTFIGILTFLQLGLGVFAQGFNVSAVGLLPLETDQTSGLVVFNNLLITHNDGAGGTALFEIAPGDGSLVREIAIQDASNVDWEDICLDQQYLYIGDIGNNFGDRTDLRIYRVSLTDYAQITGNAVEVQDTLEFSYIDQISFVPGSSHNFDAEALISFGDSLYIFTKNRGDQHTNIYSLPKEAGNHQAKRVGRIDSQGLISGGTYNPLSQEIMLTGYSSGDPFLLKISNFSGTDFDGGQIDRFDYNVQGSTQIEAIEAIDDEDYYLTSETSSDGDATLFQANATAPNAAPTINIDAPGDGHAVIEATSITFTGTAMDAEDGDISSNIIWNSDQDGDFHTGASVNTNGLSVNTHVITASITDSESITITDQISVTVNPQIAEFTAASQNGPESTTTFIATIQLAGTTDVAVDVPFSTSGTATEGAANDFTISTSPVTIPAGQLSGDITVTVNDDAEVESDETVIITLGSPTLGSLGSVTEHTMTINNDDVNTPPTSSSNTISTNESTTYTFTEADFTMGYNDPDGDPFAEIRVTTLESAGDLLLNSNPVIVNQVITAAQLNSSQLTFVPVAGQSGSPYDSFEFEVGDGMEFSVSDYTLTINVAPVNDPPTSSSNTVATNEDVTYTFTANDFTVGYNDPDGDPFAEIRVSSLESAGSLLFNGNPVTVNQIITNAQLGANQLTFVPGAGENGSPYDSFEFEVGDGTAYSANDYTLTINVDPVNDPPVVNITSPVDGITEAMGTSITFTATVSDPEGESLDGSLSWESDLDGVIGSGASFGIASLTPGTHMITARVQDSGGLEGTDVVILYINAPPVVTITQPADGTTVEAGTNIAFVATANDPEEGNLAPGLNWIASLDGGIGSGASFSTNSLSVGTQSITASVADAGGLVGNDAVTVTVTAPNAAPTISITAPSNGFITVEGTSVNFSATATDAEDDDVTLTSSIDWTSNLETGSIGTGGSFSISTLSVGTHIVTASVTDSNSETASDQITVTITQQVIDFNSASQSDDEDTGTMTATVALSQPAGSTVTVPFTLSGTATQGAGNDYTITISPLTINAGQSSANITITVNDDSQTEPDETVILTLGTPSVGTLGSPSVHTATIQDNDTPPVVNITSPPNNHTVVQGTSITFTATAMDAEDGNIAGSLIWTSSLEVGNIGTGGSFSTGSLMAGTHTITASVTDGSGLSGNDQITVIVGNQVIDFTSASQSDDEDTGTMTATVALSQPAGSTVTVPFTLSGTATQGAGNDYTVTTSPLTINAGQSSANITITVNDDSQTEPDETVILTLGTPSVGTLGSPSVHTATIQDNDTPPVVNITSPPNNHTVVQGTSITFTATAMDAEDGNIAGSLIWTSSLEVGNIGTGGSFNTGSLMAGTHTITASVTDGSGLSDNDQITVIVNNQVPVASSVNILPGATIEGQTLTGNYSYSDPENDPEGTSTFRWFRGNSVISGANNLTYTLAAADIGSNISFEVTPVAQSGASPGAFVRSPTVGPITAANSPPTNILLSSNSIPENQPVNTVVGTFSTTDPDNPGDTHTYTLVTGAGSVDNGSFNILNNQLRASGMFNFEADPSYSIRVQTEDAAGSTFPKIFTITVTNVNDLPVAVGDLNNSTSGTASIIINVAANDTDEDVGGSVVPTSVAKATNPTNGTAVNNGNGTITYTPNAGYIGGDSFTYTINDNLGATSLPGNVVITVGPNNAPVANDDLSNTTQEDLAIPINVVANDMDSDGSIDPGSISILTDPANGTAVANSNGTVTYTPNPDVNGSDEFNYSVKDNLGTSSNQARVVVTIVPVNDPPVANNDTRTTAEETLVIIDVLTNDNDLADAPSGALDPTSVAIVTNPSNGNAVVNTDGTITYTPNNGFNGSDIFTYTVDDNNNPAAISNVATVTVNVSSVNDPPVAVDDPVNPTTEENLVVISVIANDIDTDGTINPLSVTLVDLPQNGIAVNNGDGSVTYTPNQDYNGNDSFTYTVEDDLGAVSNVALVIIQIAGTNDPPIAVDDPNNTTNEDISIIINLTDNDTDLDGSIDNTSIIPAEPDNGTVSVLTNGNVQYSPDQDFNGTDSFSYTVMDNGGAISNVALVTIVVNDINDPPVAVDDVEVIDEDQVAAINLIDNDFDVDGTLIISTLLLTNPVNGTIQNNGNGTVIYTPDLNFNGQDSFSYTIEDNDEAVSNVALVNVTINDINDAPVANDDAVNTDEDMIVTINVIQNDTDIDGSIVAGSLMLVTSPANGNAIIKNNGSIDYTPNQNFNGLDTFTYTAEDDDGAQSNIATVTISVNDVNDALVANDDIVSTDEDVAVEIDILANDVDPDTPIDPTSVIIVTNTVNGVTTLNTDGTVDYAPAPLFNGQDSFTYNVKNTGGQVSNIATVTITVTDVNNLPVAANDSIRVLEDEASPLNILENDTDPDGTIGVDGITVVSSPVNGIIVITSQQVMYTPFTDYVGPDTFKYTVADDDGGVSNEATVNITVRDVNDPPTDLILSNTFVNEDELIGTAIGSFGTVDVDPDETFTYSLVAGAGGEDNGAFSIFEDQLISQVLFDQNQQEFYNIRVKTDDGDSSLIKTFVITVFSDQNPIGIKPGDLPRDHPVTNPEEIYNITVEDEVSVDTVLFRYRGITSDRNNWTIMGLVGQNRFYESTINSAAFDEIGIQYEFVVIDTNGGSINLTGFTYNQYNGDGLNFENLVFGDQVRDYNLLSIPLELYNGNVQNVMDELGPYDQTQWRLFFYQNNNLVEYTDGLNTLARGSGYWLIAKDQKSMDTGPGTTTLPEDKAFNIHLNKGWTLIGNPYGFTISWVDVLRFNNVKPGRVVADIYIHDGGYQSTGLLDPFQGAFVMSEVDTTLAVPLLKDPTIQGRSAGTPYRLQDEENWEIDLNLSTATFNDQLGGLGMRQDAESSKDQYDRIRPPRFIEYLEVHFEKPEYFMPHFSRDVVPTTNEHVWEFTVETNVTDQQIRLDWSKVPVGEYNKELWLYHKDKEVIINMQQVQQYDFANHQTHNFAVYYGDSDFIDRELHPNGALLTATYPNPFTDLLTVTFSLPSRIDSDYSRLAVFDLMGRKIKNLWEGIYRAGFYQVEWDGTYSSGGRVPSGTYLLKLDINGQESIYKRVIKN